MHEGVLILSKKTKEVIFFNKPAQKLLTKFVGVLSGDQNKENNVKIEDELQENESESSATLQNILTMSRFRPVKVSDHNVASFYKTLITRTKEAPVSLEQIILTQQDEPHQRNCIYKLKPLEQADNASNKENYTQIRVKSTEFLQQPATAIYFYDYTN